MQLITGLAAFAAAITSVNALGNAIVVNSCSFPVYLWAVDAQRNPSSPTVLAAGGSYSEGYHTPTTGGVSIKLSTTTSDTYITQFEYTVQAFDSTPFVWYDGSNVNCAGSECPFYNYGIHLQTSVSTCPTRDCPVGEVCTGFYTVYNDDINSLSCVDTADITMTLCSVNTGAAASSPEQKAAVASPAPTTTQAPVITNEAVLTTFATVYSPLAKREPAHHGHMHFHQRAQQ